MGCKHHPQHEQDGTKIFVSENKETLYDYVWRPEELYREIYTNEMKNVLTKGICIMISKRKVF